MHNPYNGRRTRRLICEELGIDDYEEFVVDLYVNQHMSGPEISEYIEANTNQSMSPRSIQRVMESRGINRNVGDAFRNAAKKGRVKWAYKDPKMKVRRHGVSKGRRYRLMSRDGFRCQLCGVGAKDALLELDHIVPLCKGGSNDDANIRTLCYECNIGKRIAEQER